MSPFARVLGVLAVVLVASCTLPPRSRAADVQLEWTITNGVDAPVRQSVVFQQVASGGTAIEGLPGRWVEVNRRDTGADANAAKAGIQQRFVVSLTPGAYTFVVRTSNNAGLGGPSNTVSPTVAPPPDLLPAAATDLTFTIVVP